MNNTAIIGLIAFACQQTCHSGLELDGLLPGIKISTSATHFAPISQVQLMRFKGETWERFGDILSAGVSG